MKFILWISLFICNIMIPVTAIVGGYWFLKKVPRENHTFGYRSSYALKSEETWRFAQGCFGIVWEMIGIGTLLPTIALSIFAYFMTAKQACILTLVLVTIQLVLLWSSGEFVERSLKSHFDEEGKLRKKEGERVSGRKRAN